MRYLFITLLTGMFMGYTLNSCSNESSEKRQLAEAKRKSDFTQIAKRNAFVEDSMAKSTMSKKDYELYLADKEIESFGYTVSSINKNGLLKNDLISVNLWNSVDKSKGIASEVITRDNPVKVTKIAVSKESPDIAYYYITAKKFNDSGWILKDWVITKP